MIMRIFGTSALRRVPKRRNAIVAAAFVPEQFRAYGEGDTNGAAFTRDCSRGITGDEGSGIACRVAERVRVGLCFLLLGRRADPIASDDASSEGLLFV